MTAFIRRQLRPALATLCLAAALLTASLPGSRAEADPVAPDGSIGINTQWENGSSTMWYIELQRYGIYDVTQGIETENDAMIREGLLQFDWGFKQQAADGSFPGTAGGSAGQMFHSSSLFIEAVARGALLLKSYHPITYTINQSYYNAEIGKCAADCKIACAWMTTSSVAAAGQAYNQVYTHRRYLLAACLAETDALNRTTTFDPAALSYARDGIELQLGAGWSGAIGAPSASGAYPAATLVAPGATAPSGTVLNLKATGVNPENNGYDSGYQCLGLFYANTYLPYCTDAAVKKKLVAMIRIGLHWEQWFVLPTGAITITGDSRMGIETDRNGNVKEPTIPTCWAAYDLGARSAGDPIDNTYASRINYYGVAVDTDTVHTNGAVGGNEDWERDHSLPWSISNQKIGVDWIERGIATENDSDIQKGIRIIDWGFQHQNANTGSFGTTQSPFYGAAAFVETAARAAHELQRYKPLTYTPLADYSSWASGVLGGCARACGWMTSPATVSHFDPQIAASTAKEWTLAAALAETGKYCGKSDLQVAADVYALSAVALQTPTGEDPESGAPDINYQALGLYAALHYAAASDSSADAVAADTAINLGLLWEGAYIAADGAITGASSPALLTMQNLYSLASALPLADADYFQIVRYRLGGIPVE